MCMYYITINKKKTEWLHILKIADHLVISKKWNMRSKSKGY